MEPLLLASTSPRRHHLLRTIGIPFVDMDPAVDEEKRDSLAPQERVIALALDKARSAAERADAGLPRLVLAADTLVCVPASTKAPTVNTSGAPAAEVVLGKPLDREDAARMIRLLSGRVHCVHTGLALLDRITGHSHTLRSDSFVFFAAVSESELSDYLDSNEWEGVAGAYRIQGWMGLFIERIEGSWSGIMGLPIHELYDILRLVKYRFRPEKAGSRGPSGL